MNRSSRNVVVTFYHDIEQDFDSDADPAECRRVTDAFIALEARHGARCTYNLVGNLFDTQPDLVSAIEHAGHEVAFHSRNHHRDWNPSHFADEVAQCRKISHRPKGYRSPRSQWNRRTLESCWEHGFLWNAENEPHTREPYFVHKGLVRLPILTDDWPVFQGRQTVDQWLGEFENALNSRPYVAIGAHDCVAATDPERWLDAWQRLLEIASRHGAQMLTFAESADLFRRGAVAKHYDATARDWNEHSKTLYRSRRFQELLSAQVLGMDKPVVADLASGGGVQSRHLADSAGHVYCVDNSRAMVESAAASGKVDARLGELTATNLPDASVDFVFCVNAIEYLFWPEHLADEILRIGRPGAACLVAFPAKGGCPERPPRSPPDRIQHYFSRDEVDAFGKLLGPGETFGIQYDPREPESAEAERRYRAFERNPPDGALPMFWVYVCQETNGQRLPSRRVVPLDRSPFELRSTRFESFMVLLRQAKKRFGRPVKRALRTLLSLRRPPAHDDASGAEPGPAIQRSRQ